MCERPAIGTDVMGGTIGRGSLSGILNLLVACFGTEGLYAVVTLARCFARTTLDTRV